MDMSWLIAACADYNGELWEALDAGTMAVRDAALCTFQVPMGGVAFATVVIGGMINIPLYNQTGGILMPFVVTLIISGIILATASALLQQLVLILVLFTLGLGPVLALKAISSR